MERTAIVQQLFAAIQAGDLGNLGNILSQDDGRPAPGITDDHIQRGLHGAAMSGSVGACRLLWAKLSGRGALMYFSAKNVSTSGAALHIAVSRGHLEIVRFFVQECNFNINLRNDRDLTPLCCVREADHLQMARFLLENGANVNPEPYSPLSLAVNFNRTELARLFLVEYHADPNLNQHPVPGPLYMGNMESAILHGNLEILSLLLQRGALLPGHGNVMPLLRRTDSTATRETKLAICRHLVQHANQQENHDRQATVAFLRASLELAIKQSSSDNMDSCQILLEAGMDPNPRWVWDCAMRRKNNAALCRLLVQFGADPLAEQEHVVFDEQYAATPFLAAARLCKKKSAGSSLFEYFLQVWDERFLDNGGKNHHSGNYPIHVVCCDACVSLPAIQILVHRHADALAVVDQEHGLYPFQLAAKCNASLDVIFCLLHHCPDAWSSSSSSSSARNASTAAAALLPAADETTNTNSTTRGDTSFTGETLRNNSASGPVRKKAKKERSP